MKKKIEATGLGFVPCAVFTSPDDAAAMNFMGVYIVYADDEIIYVGKTIDIATRWRSHERLPDFLDLGMTEVKIIPAGDRNELAEMERSLIREFNPALNRIKFKRNHRFQISLPIVKDLWLALLAHFKGVRKSQLAEQIIIDEVSSASGWESVLSDLSQEARLRGVSVDQLMAEVVSREKPDINIDSIDWTALAGDRPKS